MWGHIVVSTVRRSWGRTAVRPDKKFSLQSSAENWQWRRRTYCLRQTVPNRCWLLILRRPINTFSISGYWLLLIIRILLGIERRRRLALGLIIDTLHFACRLNHAVIYS